MNSGTKIRTLLRIAVSAYSALCIWQATVNSLGFKPVTNIWAVLIIICGWIVDFCTTWYNNDYTEEAALGTGVTRQLKAQKKEGYIGEKFAVIVNDPNGLYEAAEDDDIDEDEEENEQDDI